MRVTKSTDGPVLFLCLFEQNFIVILFMKILCILRFLFIFLLPFIYDSPVILYIDEIHEWAFTTLWRRTVRR